MPRMSECRHYWSLLKVGVEGDQTRDVWPNSACPWREGQASAATKVRPPLFQLCVTSHVPEQTKGGHWVEQSNRGTNSNNDLNQMSTEKHVIR